MQYPNVIKEAAARQRKALIVLLFRTVKIIVAAIIGMVWDLEYSVYVQSHYFFEDIYAVLIRFFNQGITITIAEVIYWITPWFCLYCLLYPVICWVQSVGIKINLFW